MTEHRKRLADAYRLIAVQHVTAIYLLTDIAEESLANIHQYSTTFNYQSIGSDEVLTFCTYEVTPLKCLQGTKFILYQVESKILHFHLF